MVGLLERYGWEVIVVSRAGGYRIGPGAGYRLGPFAYRETAVRHARRERREPETFTAVGRPGRPWSRDWIGS